MKSYFAVALLVLVIAGCGGQSQEEQAEIARQAHEEQRQAEIARLRMEVELAEAELAISSAVVQMMDYDLSDLPRLTDEYIALLRKHASRLSVEDRQRQLADVASQVDEWCADCAAALDRESDRLG